MVIWPGAILSTPRTKSNMRPAVRQAKAAEICSAHHAGRPHPALWGAGEYKSRPALPAVPHANVPFVLLDKASPALPFSTLQAGERKPCLPIVFKARLGISRRAFCCVSPAQAQRPGKPRPGVVGPNILLCPGAVRKTHYGWLCFFIPLPFLTCACRYAPNKKVMIKMKISKQITGRSKTPNRFFHIAPNKIRNRSNKKDA